MSRVYILLGLVLLSPPVQAHDFTWILYGEGLAVVSLVFSLYWVGPGNRVLWLMLMALVWGVLLGSISLTGSVLPFAAGGLLMILGQPLLARVFRSRRAAGRR